VGREELEDSVPTTMPGDEPATVDGSGMWTSAIRRAPIAGSAAVHGSLNTNQVGKRARSMARLGRSSAARSSAVASVSPTCRTVRPAIRIRNPRFSISRSRP
jgi:hypothetical protein